MIRPQDVLPRPDAIDLIVDNKKREVWEEFEKTPLTEMEIHCEPASALFAYGYKVDVAYIRDAHNPLTMWVDATITGQPRPEAIEMLKVLEGFKEQGYDKAALGRGGGPYLAGRPTKRFARWVAHTREFKHDVQRFWQEPWWEDNGRNAMRELLEIYRRKSLENLEVIKSDPEMCVADKRPGTGTGWTLPLNTRQAFGENADRFAYMIDEVVNNYYDDMVMMLDPQINPKGQAWPDIGGIIEIGNAFRGITKGSRSDAEVTNWDTVESQRLKVGVREVGTDPSSVLHNKWLNTRSWEMETWQRAGSAITDLPIDVEAWKRVLTAPPVTSTIAKNQTHDIYLLNADFGWTNELRTFTNGDWRVTVPETIKFGADNIVLTGIAMRASGRVLPHLTSGSPFTMKQYCLLHRAFEYLAHEHSLSHLRILGIGDDLQITGTLDELEVVNAYLGYALRTKGMRGNIDFVTGTYRLWLSDDDLLYWTQPRYIKSIPSPKDAEGLPVIFHGKGSDPIAVSQDAQEQCDNFWLEYKDKIMRRGSVQDMRTMLDLSYWRMKKAMAELGGASEWLNEEPILAGD